MSTTTKSKAKSFMQIKKERQVILDQLRNRKNTSAKQFEENRKRMKTR